MDSFRVAQEKKLNFSVHSNTLQVGNIWIFTPLTCTCAVDDNKKTWVGEQRMSFRVSFLAGRLFLLRNFCCFGLQYPI